MNTFGAVLCSRNDNYGGDLSKKFTYALTSMVNTLDEVYYIDWNSPEDKGSLFEEVREFIPKTGRLHVITISPEQAEILTNYNSEVQKCVEVLARNIGIRRLNTDYIISTNSDIMCGTRDNIEKYITDDSTFYTIARTDMEFNHIKDYLPGTSELTNFLMNGDNRWGQHQAGSPLGPEDKWSLISCPGDFQIAHRNVWYGIKGFEEELLYRGFTDSNVQRKADFYGFKQELLFDLKVFHFRHYPDSGSTGGAFGAWNEIGKGLLDFRGTTNSDNWGFADLTFDEEIL